MWAISDWVVSLILLVGGVLLFIFTDAPFLKITGAILAGLGFLIIVAHILVKRGREKELEEAAKKTGLRIGDKVKVTALSNVHSGVSEKTAKEMGLTKYRERYQGNLEDVGTIIGIGKISTGELLFRALWKIDDGCLYRILVDFGDYQLIGEDDTFCKI